MPRSSSGTLFVVGVNATTPTWIAINVAITTIIEVILPDLTVMITSGLTVICDQNITIAYSCITNIEFIITNTSNADVTNSFQVLIEANGMQSRTITVRGLAAGNSQYFGVALATPVGTATPTSVPTGFTGHCSHLYCAARAIVD